MMTTLNKIRAHVPCRPGWEKLLLSLGKTQADDEPLPLLTVLDSNGLEDALWCTRAVEGHENDFRLFAVWCARQVQHLMSDARSVATLDVAERYARGEDDDEELAVAWAAAKAAAGAAGDAAWAAWAAWAAAGDAAWAAGDAAWAARAAAWAARAAGDDAWAAAWAAGDAAGDAARAAARAAQEARFRQLLADGVWKGPTEPHYED